MSGLVHMVKNISERTLCIPCSTMASCVYTASIFLIISHRKWLCLKSMEIKLICCTWDSFTNWKSKPLSSSLAPLGECPLQPCCAAPSQLCSTVVGLGAGDLITECLNDSSFFPRRGEICFLEAVRIYLPSLLSCWHLLEFELAL